MTENAQWWGGMVACMVVALAAQSHDLPDPWNHIFAMLGAAGAAASGYMIRRGPAGPRNDA
jgi:hypothetical protein